MGNHICDWTTCHEYWQYQYAADKEIADKQTTPAVFMHIQNNTCIKHKDTDLHNMRKIVALRYPLPSGPAGDETAECPKKWNY